MRDKVRYLFLFCLIGVLSANNGGCSFNPSLPAKGSVVRVEKDEKGDWRLIVNGQPYFIRGVAYNPVKVGEDPAQATLRDWMIVDDNKNNKIDGPYDAFVDVNKNNRQDQNEPAIGDFQLLKEMGCNAFRLYHHASDSKTITDLYNNPTLHLLYNHKSNKELLRKLYYKYGIMVMVGDFLGAQANGSGADWEKGTDYTNLKQCENMMRSVRQMVLDFRDEPFLLLYCLGNENNLAFSRTNANFVPIIYAKFVNRVARMIHELDPYHPVVLCQGGDASRIETIAQYAPDVDIFGINFYSGSGHFGNLFSRVKKKWGKPLLITEYGDHQFGYNLFLGDESFEKHQLAYHRTAWEQIQKNMAGGGGEGNVLGGFIFEWLDNWWQGGQPYTQNGMFEFFGIASQGNGSRSPYLRQLREVYCYYKDVWNKEIP